MDKKFEDILNKINPEILDNDDVDLLEEEILDSLLVMNLVSELEQAYSLEFDPDDIMPENFSSVEAIWNTLEKYRGK